MRQGFRNSRCVSFAGCALVLAVALIANVAAQTRPVPQAPPRRAAPAPRTPTPPKRGTSSDPAEPAPARPATAPAQAKPTAATAETRPADAGAALYKKSGCYECHVNSAQGGPQGPRLGPNPIPLPRFMAYVRGPAGDMPPFTKKVLSDEDLQSIYAFLQALPQPPPVNNIPLLAP